MTDKYHHSVDGNQIIIFTDGEKLQAGPALAARMEIENPLGEGQWTHLALTWDCEAGTTLYVDGQKKAELRRDFQPVGLEEGWPGRVGCHTSFGDFPLAGTIDELRIFNYRLAEGQIRLLKDLAPAHPSIKVTGDWRKAISVRNEGRESVPLSLQA